MAEHQQQSFTSHKNGFVRTTGRFLYVTLAITFVLFATGCKSSRVYKGRVIHAISRQPLSGVKVNGSWFYRGRFAPSLDGIFLCKSKGVDTKTDKQGRFQLTLEGFGRRIAVYHSRHETVELYVDEWPKDKEIVIELQPKGEGGEQQ